MQVGSLTRNSQQRIETHYRSFLFYFQLTVSRSLEANSHLPAFSTDIVARNSGKTDECRRKNEVCCAARFPRIGERIRNFRRGGGRGKQFCRKATADGEREPSRTAGAHQIGESNLDYRKFMGVGEVCVCVCVRIRAYVYSHTRGIVR